MSRSAFPAVLGFALILSPIVDATPALADSDPCALVSKADAGRVLALPVTRTSVRSDGGTQSCTYRTTAPFPSLLVTIESRPSVADAAQTFGAMVSNPQLQTSPSTDLPGVGDQAHRLGPMIYARKGATIYVFSLLGREGNGAGALRTIALARTTLARLR